MSVGPTPREPSRGDLWSRDGVRVYVFDGADWAAVGTAAANVANAFDEMAGVAERMGDEFVVQLLRPHVMVRREDGFWLCSACGAVSWDPQVIKEIECG
jgi:hypothetical protein